MVHVLGFVSVQRRVRVCLVIGLGFGQFLCLVVSLEHWNTVNFYAFFSIFETDRRRLEHPKFLCISVYSRFPDQKNNRSEELRIVLT